MTEVYRSAHIYAAADNVWNLIREFDGLPNWHPAIGSSQIEGGMPSDQVGCVRRFTLHADGGVLREKLLALSDCDRALTYSILNSPMPVANYTATMRVTPITTDNSTFIEWWAEFNVTSGPEQDMVTHIGDNVFVTGFTAITKLLTR